MNVSKTGVGMWDGPQVLLTKRREKEEWPSVGKRRLSHSGHRRPSTPSSDGWRGDLSLESLDVGKGTRRAEPHGLETVKHIYILFRKREDGPVMMWVAVDRRPKNERACEKAYVPEAKNDARN